LMLDDASSFAPGHDIALTITPLPFTPLHAPRHFSAFDG